MNAPPGLHNQRTGEAISSDLPRRPNGISFMTAFIVSGSFASEFATIGVSIPLIDCVDADTRLTEAEQAVPRLSYV